LHKDELAAIELASDCLVPKTDQEPTINQSSNNKIIKKVLVEGHEGLGHQFAGLQLTEGPAGEHAIGGWLNWVANTN
jgi:hypothetical protein